ncbi:MAG: ABC transporter ATP-binding protein [Candidatus Levybacteria bacterium]|nr:ABC transporter ATP-binding protein [Candidatus Levybacteria bacterium]
MIELIDVCKDYLVGNEKTRILRDISLVIKDKEFVAIQGTSGSGKSTLMHIMGFLDIPTSGKILLDGKDVSRLSDDSLSKVRSEHIGFIFQQFNLINNLTVLENVMLPAIYSRNKAAFDYKKKAEELLTRFGIYERRNYLPNKISGGQQQRVAIARALIMSPKIVFADEPTGNLDSRNGAEIIKLLGELNRDFGVTIVIVTHEESIARKTNRQLFIKDGVLVKKYL